jgi:hypothetical protein
MQADNESFRPQGTGDVEIDGLRTAFDFERLIVSRSVFRDIVDRQASALARLFARTPVVSKAAR